ncbi:MAG: hypothetical protein P4M13_10440 [Alphaproteobacteria bacterium]|nr:hypothetical protein [Alphaproteobacteria bacterium]
MRNDQLTQNQKDFMAALFVNKHLTEEIRIGGVNCISGRLDLENGYFLRIALRADNHSPLGAAEYWAWALDAKAEGNLEVGTLLRLNGYEELQKYISNVNSWGAYAPSLTRLRRSFQEIFPCSLTQTKPPRQGRKRRSWLRRPVFDNTVNSNALKIS